MLEEPTTVSEPSTKIDPKLVSLTDLSEKHIPLVADYWFRSPPGFIESMGVDPQKLPPESEFVSGLNDKCSRNKKLSSSKLQALIISYDDQPVGLHTVNPLAENDVAIFHAHVFKPSLRRCGLARLTYPMASMIFIERFDLKRLLYKTPIQNIGAIRVKEDLGIRYLGEELIGFGIIRDGTLAKVYELTPNEAEILVQRTGHQLSRDDGKWMLWKEF